MPKRKTTTEDKENINHLKKSLGETNSNYQKLNDMVNDLNKSLKKNKDDKKILEEKYNDLIKKHEDMNNKFDFLGSNQKDLIVKYDYLVEKYELLMDKVSAFENKIKESTLDKALLYEGSELYVNKSLLSILKDDKLSCTSFVRNILTAVFNADELVDHNLKGTGKGKLKLDSVKLNELHEAASKYFGKNYNKSSVNKTIQDKLLIVHTHLDNIRSNKPQNKSSKLLDTDLIGFELYEDFIKRYNYENKDNDNDEIDKQKFSDDDDSEKEEDSETDDDDDKTKDSSDDDDE